MGGSGLERYSSMLPPCTHFTSKAGGDWLVTDRRPCSGVQTQLRALIYRLLLIISVDRWKMRSLTIVAALWFTRPIISSFLEAASENSITGKLLLYLCKWCGEQSQPGWRAQARPPLHVFQVTVARSEVIALCVPVLLRHASLLLHSCWRHAMIVWQMTCHLTVCSWRH